MQQEPSMNSLLSKISEETRITNEPVEKTVVDDVAGCVILVALKSELLLVAELFANPDEVAEHPAASHVHLPPACLQFGDDAFWSQRFKQKIRITTSLPSNFQVQKNTAICCAPRHSINPMTTTS
jgi:hypothetical protein